MNFLLTVNSKLSYKEIISKSVKPTRMWSKWDDRCTILFQSEVQDYDDENRLQYDKKSGIHLKIFVG